MLKSFLCSLIQMLLDVLTEVERVLLFTLLIIKCQRNAMRCEVGHYEM